MYLAGAAIPGLIVDKSPPNAIPIHKSIIGNPTSPTALSPSAYGSSAAARIQ